MAARHDPLAAAQLGLVRTMALTANGAPAAFLRRKSSPTELIFAYFRHSLPGMSAVISQRLEPLLTPARVIDPATGRHIEHPVRTSDGCVIGPAQEDLVVQALNHRIAAASSTPTTHGEPLAILRYAPGQRYRPHHDTVAGASNQRNWTMLVYLNDGYAGGADAFPHLDLTVRGRRGDGLLFRNTKTDDRPDPLALHEGQPIIGGPNGSRPAGYGRQPMTLGRQGRDVGRISRARIGHIGPRGR
ncbi:2OG-Fe(II) oxygenase [Sphingomonas aerolata]|uniref:2OG-Fe(II) oxygenase n=1 Tax=Sphingomonas aerolata TaxID=185951 RepID=UPI002FE109A3